MNNDKHPPLGSWSIRTRLTFLYGLTTVFLFVVLSFFFYLTTLHILHNGNRQFLTDEIRVLRKLLESQPNNLLALKQEWIDTSEMETESEYRYYVRILDQNNHVILQTPNFNNALKQSIFFGPPHNLPDNQIVHWRSPTHQFVLMQTNRQPFLIQVALDITWQQGIVNHYSKLWIVTLFSIILIAMGLGYLMGNRATQSLYQLTETTRKITLGSLHQRIDLTHFPKELQMLGMAFNDMLDRIEKAVAQLARFSGDLAHELRTPVNNLMGETEIVLSRPHTIEAYQSVLESHLEELQRLARIIENILFLARTENPKWDVQKETLSVAREIQLLIEFYQAMADEKNIQITQTGDAKITVNRTLFERMLSNLLSNALKYTPEKGSIQFIARESDCEIEIILQDTGIGIAAEHIPHVFNRFYRVDSARARSAGGVGLGLSIVKSIVELHHGSIHIDSVPEKGTRITLVFPKSV